MDDKVKVILDLSEEVQILLEQQGVDIYEELQREIPSLYIHREPDPAALKGSRDLVPVLYGVAAVITSLTPVLLTILKQITPPNRAKTWVVEEIETRQPDGTTTIHRRQVRASDEQRPWASLPLPESQITPSGQPLATQDISDKNP